MSIIGNNVNGKAAMLALMKHAKKNNAIIGNPTAGNFSHTNRLFVEYARSEFNGEIEAPEGSIFYHADIKHYDEAGHLNTATTVFEVNLVAEKKKGEDAVKEELNQIVATKMKALIDLHKNS